MLTTVYRLTLAFSITVFTFLTACTQPTDARIEKKTYDKMLQKLLSHTVPEVSVSEAKQLKDAVFLDAREPEEYQVSHIAKAQFVGYDHFDMKTVKGIDKNQKIVVYCSVGYRSEKISEQLLAAGFTDVSNLYGGIFEWKNQDQEVVDAQGKTEKVHAYDRLWGVWLKEGEKVYKIE
ncbi:MAG: rhodanese-like domain-containing protein [Bacteroidota bacterium]